MRSLHICALLGALIDLPVSHGFPSGNIPYPARHALTSRYFPRSPGPLRARVSNAASLLLQDPLSGQVPRRDPALDELHLGHVHLAFGDIDHGAQNPLVAATSRTRTVTMRR